MLRRQEGRGKKLPEGSPLVYALIRQGNELKRSLNIWASVRQEQKLEGSSNIQGSDRQEQKLQRNLNIQALEDRNKNSRGV
jgi:hypothetical protein